MDGHESAPPLRPPQSRYLERYIPSIRFAFQKLNKDRAELELIVARMCREELFKTCWRDGAIRRGRMECLVKFLDTALTRTIVVLDGMGYSPTNLPPSSPVRTN